MLRRRSRETPNRQMREPPNRQMREPPSSFANAFRVAYGSHSLRLLCCHLCCIALRAVPYAGIADTRRRADEQIEDDEDGRSKTLSGKLQRKLRGGAGAVAGALVLAHACLFWPISTIATGGCASARLWGPTLRCSMSVASAASRCTRCPRATRAWASPTASPPTSTR